MFGFGRKKLTPAQQLERGRWRCQQCDKEHGWPFDLTARAPDPWVHDREYEPNSALDFGADFLSEDFCIMDELAGFLEGSAPPAVWVQPRPGRQRPLLWIRDDNHPLAIAQEEGITPEEVLRIFAAYGHAPG